jgi:transcriptional regulator of acetoin/glycerol metabolism
MRAVNLLPEREYRAAVAENRFIIEKSVPILDQVSKLLIGVPGILILADRKGTILHVIGDPSVRQRAAEDSGLVEGTCWQESQAGTNGIGTAIDRKEAVHIFSNEHFCEGWHQWSCAATPIQDPFTDEILGVIDFTTFDHDYREDAVGLTYSLSGQIKAELRLQLELERMQLIHGFSDYSSRYPADGIVVLDRMGRVVRSSPGIDPGRWDSRLRSKGQRELPKKFQHIYLPGTELEIGALLVVERGGPTLISPAPAADKKIHCVATFGEFVTADENLKAIMERVARVSSSNINVLLIGETGTGKEIIANYIHTHSRRHTGPLIAINCGAISKELFESKFFGYERGAFTGADPRGRKGVFECANGGTLFLDEVGEMPLDIQAALLRVLETGRFRRIGSDKEFSTDCRIVAATNRSLLEEIERGAFRADLYYRLGVAKFDIPPLRKRGEDIPVLIQHAMISLSRKHDIPPALIAPEAMALLTRHNWPGNGREIRNVIESAMICGGETIDVQDLPLNIRQEHQDPPPTKRAQQLATETEEDSPQRDYRITTNISHSEAQLIVSTLEKYRNIAHACLALEISRATFYRKCKAYGITPKQYT